MPGQSSKAYPLNAQSDGAASFSVFAQSLFSFPSTQKRAPSIILGLGPDYGAKNYSFKNCLESSFEKLLWKPFWHTVKRGPFQSFTVLGSHSWFWREKRDSKNSFGQRSFQRTFQRRHFMHRNRDPVLFGPWRTGLALPWTTYRVGGLSEGAAGMLLRIDLCSHCGLLKDSILSNWG